jgi:hypothetical protein
MIIGLLILAYLAFVLAFAVAFVVKAALVIDQSTHGTGIRFRLMILPGSILLWPYLLFRWIKSGCNP